MQLKKVGSSGRIVVGMNAPVADSAALEDDGKYYTLDGRQAQPTTKGYYVHNGKTLLRQ